MSKVRIYDLAKELKLESKKILEDARRMGVDVSVPSNTLEDNIAAKIREMYYPKKEQAPAIHKARLIKHQTAPGPPAEQSAAAPAVIEKAQQAAMPAEAEPPARSSPPVSQTTIKPITPPKPVSASQAAAKPSPPAAQAQKQTAAPGAEPKPRVIKLAPPPAAEPEQAPGAEVEPAAPPEPVDKELVTAPQVEEIEQKQIGASARAAEAAPVAKPHAPAAPPKPAGTKVIKLKTPTQPMPKPAPPKPAPPK